MGEASRSELLEELALELRLEQLRAQRFQSDLIQLNTKQWQFLTSTHKYTMFRGLNRGGKSTASVIKQRYHLCGDYPEGYTGFRHQKPITMIIGGVTGQTTRDLLVNRLLGTPNSRGTGFIPADRFDPKEDIVRIGGGVADQIDYFRVKHSTDGLFDGYSIAYVIAYATNWRRMAGYPADRIALDEEPPWMVFDELIARLTDTDGWLDISLTPLDGVTEIIKKFEENDDGNHRIIEYGIDDVEHWSDDLKQKAIKKYRNSPMAEPRLYGRPVRGTGIIYPTPDTMVVCDPIEIPGHWKQIIGVDFPHTRGHFAAVRLALDPDHDILYLVSEFKAEAQDISLYINRLRTMGGETLPIAWPHDGNREVEAGATVAEVYRRHRLNMLPTHAHQLDIFGQKSVSVIPVIEALSERMNDGRFKVFRTCSQYLDEKRSYRQEDGKPLRVQNNHLIDAKHKAYMMLRYAVPGPKFTVTPMVKLREQLSEADW